MTVQGGCQYRNLTCALIKNNSYIMKNYPSGVREKSQCKKQIIQLIGLRFILPGCIQHMIVLSQNSLP